MLGIFSACFLPTVSAYGSPVEETELNRSSRELEDSTADLTPDESATELINGALAGTRRPEVVRVTMLDPLTGQNEDCTATRIGERHFLTAAHCFVDLRKETPISNYGATVEFRHKEDSNSNPIGSYKLDLRVSKQINEPGFLYSPQITNDIAVWSIKPGNVAWRTSPSLPIVDNSSVKAFNDVGVAVRSISTSTPAVGQTVTMFGYGCHLKPNPDPFSDYKKRYGANTIVELSPTAFPTHFTTFIGAASNLPQGCDGDSGGPVFSGTTDTSTIIGVNSGVTSTYQNTLIARIDGARGHWINKQVSTPIIDSHNNKVFKSFSSFKVYGYKLDAVGFNSTKTVLKFRYGTAPNYTYATLNSTTEGCPTPTAGEGASACFATAGLSTVPNNTVGDWVASRQISIGGTVRTLESVGQGKVRICSSATTTCNNP
jgi:V8-like Glu-specific endopeptidase